MKNFNFKKTATAAAVGLGSIAATLPAFAVDPTTGIEAVTSLQGSSTGYGPVMYGLAVSVVGIMIAVKWIKRAKGAA